MKKTIFIVPGYKHRPTSKAYKQIATILKNEGYSPIPVTIPWRKNTISQNTEHFLRKYKKVNSRKKYILGFSFGAMIAFLASTKVSVNGLILCSLSPYFNEDIYQIDTSWMSHMKAKRYKDYRQLRFTTLVKKLKAKQILMLYGLNEEKSLIKRVTQGYEQISSKQKYLIPIDETEHDIGNKKYLLKIHQIVKQLN